MTRRFSRFVVKIVLTFGLLSAGTSAFADEMLVWNGRPVCTAAVENRTIEG